MDLTKWTDPKNLQAAVFHVIAWAVGIVTLVRPGFTEPAAVQTWVPIACFLASGLLAAVHIFAGHWLDVETAKVVKLVDEVKAEVERDLGPLVSLPQLNTTLNNLRSEFGTAVGKVSTALDSHAHATPPPAVVVTQDPASAGQAATSVAAATGDNMTGPAVVPPVAPVPPPVV